MDTYTIKKAYPFTNDNEIEISSENLLYAELGKTHFGVQVSNLENYKKIQKLCCKVADLIREIDELNKPLLT